MTTEDNEYLSTFTPPALSEDFYARLKDGIEAKPDTVSDTAGVSNVSVLRRHWRSFAATTLAAAACVAVISAGVLTNSTNSDNSPKDVAQQTTTTTAFAPTLVAQVIDRAKKSYSTVEGISGTSTQQEFCVQEKPPATQIPCDQTEYPIKKVNEFRVRSNGDYWTNLISDEGNAAADGLGKKYPYVSSAGSIEAYDAATNELSSLSPKGKRGKTVGDASSSPMPRVFGSFTLQSLLDGLSLDESSKLENVTLDGRPAWKIEASGLPLDAFGTSPDGVVAYFDQKTLLPLKVTELKNAQTLRETTISAINVNPTFGENDFKIDAQTTPLPVTFTGPWKTATLDTVANQVSYKPLFPASVPDGFTLSNVRYAENAGASGAEGSNPTNKDVIAFDYVRGLDRLTVTTRLAGSGLDWVDPYSAEGQINAKSSTVNIVGGAYNGEQATLVTGFGTQPHIWIKGATLVTTVIGDVSARDLQDVMGSLQRQ